MKFKLMITATVCAALVGCLFGCNDATDSLWAKCAFGDDSLTLPLRFESAHAAWYGTYFLSSESLSEMETALNAADFGGDAVSATLHGNVLLLEKTDTEGNVHFYSVESVNPNDPAAYAFTNLSEVYSIGEESAVVLIPRHLLSCSAEELGAGIKLGESYPVSAQPSEFAAFYRRAGGYEVMEGEELTVLGENFALTIAFDEGFVRFISRE